MDFKIKTNVDSLDQSTEEGFFFLPKVFVLCQTHARVREVSGQLVTAKVEKKIVRKTLSCCN